MRSRLLKTTLVAFVAMSGLAAQCMTITDPLVVSVNVKDIKDTYNVTPGRSTSIPGCKVKNSATTSTASTTSRAADGWWTSS